LFVFVTVGLLRKSKEPRMFEWTAKLQIHSGRLSWATHTHTCRFYGTAFGENTYGISRFTRVSCFVPWILPLHKLLSFASAGDKAHILISSYNVFIHVFLGLPLGLLPSTSILVHLFAQSSSPFLSTCPNHLNLFLLHTSMTGSTPVPALSSVVRILSLKGWKNYKKIKFSTCSI
jgi:hypothetical protein